MAIAIYTSKIEIEVQNLKIDTEKPKGEKINKDSKIFVKTSFAIQKIKTKAFLSLFSLISHSFQLHL